MTTGTPGTCLCLPMKIDALSQPSFSCPGRQSGDVTATSTSEMETRSPFRTLFVGSLLKEEGEHNGRGICSAGSRGRSAGTNEDLASERMNLNSQAESAAEGTAQNIEKGHMGVVSGKDASVCWNLRGLLEPSPVNHEHAALQDIGCPLPQLNLSKTKAVSLPSIKQTCCVQKLTRLEAQEKWGRKGREATDGRCTSTTSSTLSGSKENYSSLYHPCPSSSITDADAQSFGSFPPVAFPQTSPSRPCSVSSLLSASLVCLVTAPGCSSPHETTPGSVSTPSLSFPPSQLAAETGSSDSDSEGVSSLGATGTSFFLDMPLTSHTPNGATFPSDAAWSFSPSNEANGVPNALANESDSWMQFGPGGLREEESDEALESLSSNLTYASLCGSPEDESDAGKAEPKEPRVPVLWHPAKFSPWPNAWRCRQTEKSDEASPGHQRGSPHGLIGPVMRSVSGTSSRLTTTASAAARFAESPTFLSVGKMAFGSKTDDEQDSECLLPALKPTTSFPSYVSQTSSSTACCTSAPISPSKLPEATHASEVQSPSSRRSNASSGGFFPHSDSGSAQRDGRKELESLCAGEGNDCPTLVQTERNQAARGNSPLVSPACADTGFDRKHFALDDTRRLFGSDLVEERDMPRQGQCGDDRGHHAFSRYGEPWSCIPHSETDSRHLSPDAAPCFVLPSSTALLSLGGSALLRDPEGQGHTEKRGERDGIIAMPNREQRMPGLSETSPFQGWAAPGPLPSGLVYRDTSFRPARYASPVDGGLPHSFHPAYPVEVPRATAKQIASTGQEGVLSPNADLGGMTSAPQVSDSVGPTPDQSWIAYPRNPLRSYTSAVAELDVHGEHAVLLPQLREGEASGRKPEQTPPGSFHPGNGQCSGFPTGPQALGRSPSYPDCEPRSSCARPFAGFHARPAFPPPPPGPRLAGGLSRVCHTDPRRPVVASMQERGAPRPGLFSLDRQSDSGMERRDTVARGMVHESGGFAGNAPLRGHQPAPHDASNFFENGQALRGKPGNGVAHGLKSGSADFGARHFKASRPVPQPPPPEFPSHGASCASLPQASQGVDTPSLVSPFPPSPNIVNGENPEQRVQGMEGMPVPVGITLGAGMTTQGGRDPLDLGAKQHTTNPSNSPGFTGTGDIGETFPACPQRPSSPMSLTLNRLLAAYCGPAPEKFLACPSAVAALPAASSQAPVQKDQQPREGPPGGPTPGTAGGGSRGGGGRRLLPGKGARSTTCNGTPPVNLAPRLQARHERPGCFTPTTHGLGLGKAAVHTSLFQPAGAWRARMPPRGKDGSAGKNKEERRD
ncbi:conserved hypothetical protein [Neospora caninum Liverpool]|uniref:Uncharacterized protein n=1 Tax=Neospora caninum (strain Liverpool) TaxID=572307 RepID=F0VMM7_NEOCL|nr:conserved hypothetical protein [Neospora caninum Liverpool]CBZ54973.1 conserved hypothetical protein [Neospora caninum Liverpool]CEL69695.1 TPA: hypothetical protein BN1204_054000 [Neospora caninum Liverpool]|eukprot:XP_003885001.1 conserved hypothetical protein [Neospora caninum Liverpool]